MEIKRQRQPSELLITLQDDDVGIKRERVNVGTTTVNAGLWSDVIKRYSVRNRPRRVAAWILRASQKLQRKLRSRKQLNEVPRVGGEDSKAERMPL